MTDKTRKLIVELGNVPPARLRCILYDNMPGTMDQIKKLFKTRGELLLAAIEVKLNT